MDKNDKLGLAIELGGGILLLACALWPEVIGLRIALGLLASCMLLDGLYYLYENGKEK